MIKLVLLAAITLTAAVLVRGRRGVRHQALRRIALVLFAAGAALSLFFPLTWTWAADALGVGRGTDLLVYLLIVAFLGTVATSFVRFQELQHQVTVLARRLALDSAPAPSRDAEPAVPPHPVEDPAGPRTRAS